MQWNPVQYTNYIPSLKFLLWEEKGRMLGQALESGRSFPFPPSPLFFLFLFSLRCEWWGFWGWGKREGLRRMWGPRVIYSVQCFSVYAIHRGAEAETEAEAEAEVERKRERENAHAPTHFPANSLLPQHPFFIYRSSINLFFPYLELLLGERI